MKASTNTLKSWQCFLQDFW